MKQLIMILLLLGLGIESSNAQVKQVPVTVSYAQQTVEFVPPASGKGTSAHSLIQVRTKSGEGYGIGFNRMAGTAPFIELLDAAGKTVKAITADEIAGKASSNGVKLMTSFTAGSSNRSETVYEIAHAQGTYQLVLGSIATAAAPTNDTPAKLLWKVSLRNAPAAITGARVSLAFDGAAEAKTNGFVLSGVKSGLALSAAVYPNPNKVTVTGKSVIIATAPVRSKVEAVVALITIDAAASKAEAAAQLQSAEKSTANDIAIVTTTDKVSAQPADTITYHIVCSNIGKGTVNDIVISNPVSAGTVYLEGSASGEDTQISYERAAAQAPQKGDVTLIKWKLLSPLAPGGEKVVSFKVLVR